MIEMTGLLAGGDFVWDAGSLSVSWQGKDFLKTIIA
jgi:hypothetical protein